MAIAWFWLGSPYTSTLNSLDLPPDTRPVAPQRAIAIRWLIFIALALLVFTLDQASKAAVTATLAVGDSWAPLPALASIFEITHSTNSGAAFSIFQGNNTPLLLLSLAMIVGIVVIFIQTAQSRLLQTIALAILLGGVMGNALDRLRLGMVVDFIHWQLPNVISNVSNVADHAIVLSVVLLFIASHRSPKGDPAI